VQHEAERRTQVAVGSGVERSGGARVPGKRVAKDGRVHRVAGCHANGVPSTTPESRGGGARAADAMASRSLRATVVRHHGAHFDPPAAGASLHVDLERPAEQHCPRHMGPELRSRREHHRISSTGGVAVHRCAKPRDAPDGRRDPTARDAPRRLLHATWDPAVPQEAEARERMGRRRPYLQNLRRP